MARRLQTRVLPLLVALWLPLCCCQWQAVGAVVDAEELLRGCAASCCGSSTAPPRPSDPERSPGSEPCGVSCCVRGEIVIEHWSVPLDRAGRAARTAVDAPGPDEAGTIDPHRHEPPWLQPRRCVLSILQV
jgi:hypothetical protein